MKLLDFSPPPVAALPHPTGDDLEADNLLRFVEMGAGFTAALHAAGVDVVLITDAAVAAAVARELVAHDGPVAVDFETVGLHPVPGRLRLIQAYAGGGVAIVIDVAAVGFDAVRGLFSRRLVAHAATYEAMWLLAHGVEPDLDDTLLLAATPEGGTKDAGTLLDIVATYCPSLIQPGTAAKKTMQESRWNGPLTKGQIDYAAFDVVATLALWHALQQYLDTPYEIARGTVRAIAAAQLRGLPVDVPAHAAVCDLWTPLLKQEADTFERIITASGVPFKRNKSLAVRQTKEIGNWLRATLPHGVIDAWPKTPSGALCLDKDTLPERAHLHDALDALHGYGQIDAAYKTFGPALSEYIRKDTGRIHAGLRLLSAKTGRMSASKPNILGVPRGDFRRIFRAPEGRRLVKADFSAVELRAIALEAQEDTLFDVFQHPAKVDGVDNAAGDPHRQIMELMTGKYLPEQRPLAKGINFGTTYKCGPGGLLVQLVRSGQRLTLNDATQWLRLWQRSRPRVVRWQDKTIDEGKRRRYVETPCGRRVSTYETLKGVLTFRGTLACNIRIQGGCAEAVMLAATAVDKLLREEALDAGIVAVVHDEIVVDASEAHAEMVGEVLVYGMQQGFAQVYSGYTNYDKVSAHLLSGYEVMDTWGGDALDPTHLPAKLSKGLTLRDSTAQVTAAAVHAPVIKLLDVVSPALFDSYLRYVDEREKVQQRKDSGAVMPWTSEPILQAHSFTCNRREDDRTTRALKMHCRDPFGASAYGWCGVVIGRLTNRPQWFEVFTELAAWPKDTVDVDAVEHALLIAASRGAKMSDAYVIPSSLTEKNIDQHYGMRRRIAQCREHYQLAAPPVKLLGLARVLFPAVAALQAQVYDVKTLRELTDTLQRAKGIGDFLSFQFAVDMRWCDGTPWSLLPDRDDYALAGPGALTCLAYLLGRAPTTQLNKHGKKIVNSGAARTTVSQYEAQIFMPQIRDELHKLIGVSLIASDVQNTLCEGSKWLSACDGASDLVRYQRKG